MFTDSGSVYWSVSTPPTINVTIIDDDIVESEEVFTLSLEIITNQFNINTSISQLQLTIRDNGKGNILNFLQIYEALF